jgi:hypothetical protein
VVVIHNILVKTPVKIERVNIMITIAKKQLETIDINNMKALAVIQTLLFALTHGDVGDFDITSTLEVIQDYLANNNAFFNVN